MNNWIRAFARAARAVLTFVSEQLLPGIQARAEIAWENFDTWLANHGWTLSEFIGLVIRYCLTVFVSGFTITLIGLGIGSLGFTEFARGVVLCGLIVGIFGCLPLTLTFMFAQRLYDLIFNTSHFCAELFTNGDADNIPARLRDQLNKLRKNPATPVPLELMFTIYLGAHMFFYLFPVIPSINQAIVIASFGFITFVLRTRMEVKGWAIKHFVFALLMGAMWFATPAFFITQWINWLPEVSAHYTSDSQRILVQLGVSFVVLVISVIMLYKTTHSNSSDEALDSGDVQRLAYKKKVVSLDSEGKPVYELVTSKPIDWSWLKPKYVLVGLAIIGWLVWTQVLGHPSPLDALLALSFKKVMILGIVTGLALVAYSKLPGKEG